MAYAPQVQPFRSRVLADGFVLATSRSGDHAFFAPDEFDQFRQSPQLLSLRRQAELRARFLLGDSHPSIGVRRLIASRIAAKRETVSSGPSLHILVPTLQCAHSCRYCQVSRSLHDQGHTLSLADLDAACDTIFESPSPTLTVEFQGGDPLLRFDLIERAVLRIKARNVAESRRIRFVVASTLHQLDTPMCAFFKAHGVHLSTSIDGPRELHNRNRPIPGRDSYERTAAGITLAREHMGHDSVAALMTTTKASLDHADAIVDEYVRLTNRCNSYCLMCSQPPTLADDSWLVDEAIDAIRHLRSPPLVLGLTGGEPLLLGAGLRRVLDAVSEYLPGTQVEVLTNGRLFSECRVAERVLTGLSTPVRWLVPLYGHADFVHDFVVQAPGAFDETLAGLMALQAQRQEVQLRVVLIEPVLQVLPELSGFIARNLPFVREVALMGCEPIGFALANRELCEVDLAQWSDTLELAARQLRRHDIPHLLMNAPLCSLPKALWPIAHRSISDWKNVYVEECKACCVKSDCSGLFAWHERGWKPAPLKTIGSAEAIA